MASSEAGDSSGTTSSAAGAEARSKPPSASAVRTVYMTFPNDANVHGTVFGGVILEWIDQVGAMSAVRHSRVPVVTAQIDAVVFRTPIDVGELAIVNGVVTRTWTTSMEVRVTVDAEHPLSGDARRAVEAFLTFVGVDQAGGPVPIRQLAPETERERRLWAGAERRRLARLEARLARAEEDGDDEAGSK